MENYDEVPHVHVQYGDGCGVDYSGSDDGFDAFFNDDYDDYEGEFYDFDWDPEEGDDF